MSKALEMHLDINFGPEPAGAVLILLRSGDEQRRYTVPARCFSDCLIDAIDELKNSRAERD